jgi:hypothetical protein
MIAKQLRSIKYATKKHNDVKTNLKDVDKNQTKTS